MSQVPDEPKRREDLLRMDFQATDTWRITGRYMHNNEEILQAYGTTWAGNGSDQLPTPSLFIHPGSNYMLSATGVINNSTSLELSWGRASNSLNYELQLDPLFRSNAGVSGLPLLFPDAVQADYVPWFVFRGGRTDNAGQYQTDRGPFTNENITHDVIANLTKVWGSHASKFGFYFQHSYKPQSIFASFNSQIDFTDNTNNPFDTGFSYANAATGVFNFYQQANKYAIPEWQLQEHRVVRPGQLEAEPAVHARLRCPVLLLDPAVGQEPAGLELPAGRVRPERRGEAVLPGLHRCASVLG